MFAVFALTHSLHRDDSFRGCATPYGSFHPTALDKGYTILNSSTCRGEGAISFARSLQLVATPRCSFRSWTTLGGTFGLMLRRTFTSIPLPYTKGLTRYEGQALK